MAIVHFTKDSFDQLVRNAKGAALVDFWAPWCNPCKMQGPIIDQIDGEVSDDVTIGKVNVDEEQSLAVEFGVMTIPTIIIFRDGREVKRVSGLQSKQALLAMLE